MSDGVAVCADCGNEYPVGGHMGRDDNPEVADDHEPTCPVYAVLRMRELRKKNKRQYSEMGEIQ